MDAHMITMTMVRERVSLPVGASIMMEVSSLEAENVLGLGCSTQGAHYTLETNID